MIPDPLRSGPRRPGTGLLARVALLLLTLLLLVSCAVLEGALQTNARTTPASQAEEAWTAVRGISLPDIATQVANEDEPEATAIAEDGHYTALRDVVRYLEAYGRLPSNFITKAEAQRLGWSPQRGNLAEVAPGRSIGPEHFGNFEGRLPDAPGRRWSACDIDYVAGHRGARRLVYSSDGLYFFTEDHYEHFTAIDPARLEEP